MQKIKKGMKFYAFYDNGKEVVLTVELAVSNKKADKQGYEAVVVASCPSAYISATASVFIYFNPKNESQPIVELIGFLVCEVSEEDSPEFWEDLFKNCVFRTTAMTAYSHYFRSETKKFEAYRLAQLEKDALQLAKEKTSKESLLKQKNEDAFLKEYATRYGLISKDYLDPNVFEKEASNIGDTVFASISCYGLHTFAIKDKPSENVVIVDGVNKYTNSKVTLTCFDLGHCLVVSNIVVSDCSSHWYTDMDLQSEDFDLKVVLRKSVKRAIQDSVSRSIHFHGKKIEELKGLNLERKAGLDRQLKSMNEAMQGLNAALR